jgi:hypothetical protein
VSDDPTPQTPEEPSPEPSRHLIPFTPVPRLKDRSDGWKPEVQRAFIEALADTGSVAAACRMVGRSERSAYNLRRHPEAGEFAAAWAAAQGHGVLRLQDAVLDRALNGIEVPLVAYGEIVGTYRKYDNRLAAFILRNHLPEQYGADGGGRAGHAIDAKKLERAKKDWQAEREAQEAEEAAGMGDFVDSIAEMHVRWWADCGPRTRAAYIHFRRLERIEYRTWLDEEEDIEAALAEAQAQYAEVFADDARSLAKKLGEVCWAGVERTCPELDEDDGSKPLPDSAPPLAGDDGDTDPAKRDRGSSAG